MLKIAQSNLQHKKSASYHFYRKIERENFSVALIQEPYTYQGKLVGLDSRVWAYYSVTDGADPLAAIIVKKDLVSFPVNEHITTDVVIVNLKLADNLPGGLFLCSVYCPQSRLGVPRELELFFGASGTPRRVIIGADTNAHSTLLEYSFSDPPAEKWEDFLLIHSVFLINDPVSTFQNSRGHESKIDWTIASPEVHIQSWHSDLGDTLSDHSFISYSVAVHPAVSTERIYNFKRINYPKLLEIFDALVKERSILQVSPSN